VDHLQGDSSSGNQQAETESRITLDLLDAVQQNSLLSQRSLAKELGIALGLTNSYLKRCIRKGWIKVKQAPANRYAYYVTPKGFAEKGRLTSRYLSRSFQFYAEARNQLDEAVADCSARGWRRVAFLGAGELAEIALLCALQHPIKVIGIADADRAPGKFRHVKLERDLMALGPVDAVIVTDLKTPQRAFDRLAAEFAPERIQTPPLLKIARDGGARGIAP
jgi:DNA-binding MarR family transcriptional regulator